MTKVCGIIEQRGIAVSIVSGSKRYQARFIAGGIEHRTGWCKDPITASFRADLKLSEMGYRAKRMFTTYIGDDGRIKSA